MSKESPYSPYPNLIFRETFNDESTVRRNGGTFPNGSGNGFSNGTYLGTLDEDNVIYINQLQSNFDDGFSVRARVKVDNTSLANERFLHLIDSKGNVLQFATGGSSSGEINACYTRIGPTYFDRKTATSFNDGTEFIELIFTFDGTTEKFYANGVDQTTAGIALAVSTLNIICSNSSTLKVENTWDLFEFYDKALTASQVSGLYNDSWNKEQVFNGSAKANAVSNGFDWVDSNSDGLADDFAIEADVGATTSIVEGQRIEVSAANISDGNYWKVNLRSDTAASTTIFPVDTKVVVNFRGRANMAMEYMQFRRGSSANWKTFSLTSDWQDISFETTIIGSNVSWLNTIVLDSTKLSLGNWFEIDNFTIQPLNPKTLIDFDSTNGVLEDRTVGNTVGEQLLSNNDFTNGQTGWLFWYGNDTATFTDNQMYLPGDSNRYYQSNATEVGKKYRAIIRYKSDLSWGAGNSSYTSNIDASEDWTIATIEFVMVSQPHFYIAAMTANSNVYIDYIILKEIRDDLSATDVIVNKNGALFNGTSSEIDTGSTFNGLTGAITVMAWVKLYGFKGSSNPVILYNSKFILYFTPSSSQFHCSSDGIKITVSGTDLIQLNKWIFISITRESDGTVNHYIADKTTAPALSGSSDQDSGTPVSSSNNLLIGRNNIGSGEYHGLIGKIKVVEGILSLQEISNYWSSSLKEIN